MRDLNSPEVVVEEAMKDSFANLRKDLVAAKIDALVSRVEVDLLIGVITALLKKHPEIAKEVAKDHGEQ